MITPPGPGGFSCPPLLQQAVCPPCKPTPPSSSSRLPLPLLGHRSPASSRTPKRLPLTMALAGGEEAMGQGPATVYVGPWSECQSRHEDKREPRDTRMREPGGSSRVTLPRSLPPLPGPPPASPHFPLPWLPASSPSPSGPSSPAPVLGERQRNVVCRSDYTHTKSCHSMSVNLMTRMSMKNLIAERQMVRQRLSRSAWTEVEQQWCPRIGEAVLSQEIVLLQPGLLGLLQTPSPVLQVLIII